MMGWRGGWVAGRARRAGWGRRDRVAAAARCVAACAVAMSLPVAAAAQDTTWNRYTLEGLGGVFVRADTNLGCEGAGVSAESMRADAVAVLEAAEVPLLGRDEMLADPGLPELRVTFECGGGVAGMVGYSVSVRVQQATQMIRDTQITLSEAVTWWASGVGVAEAGGVVQALKGVMEGKLGEFVEAFGEANGEGG